METTRTKNGVTVSLSNEEEKDLLAVLIEAKQFIEAFKGSNMPESMFKLGGLLDQYTGHTVTTDRIEKPDEDARKVA